MPNKWTESYNIYKTKIGKYINLIVAWDGIHRDAEPGYYMSVNFNNAKWPKPIDSSKEARKKILYLTKTVIEQMLVDINQAIEEEEKEQ